MAFTTPQCALNFGLINKQTKKKNTIKGYKITCLDFAREHQTWHQKVEEGFVPREEKKSTCC